MFAVNAGWNKPLTGLDGGQEELSATDFLFLHSGDNVVVSAMVRKKSRKRGSKTFWYWSGDNADISCGTHFSAQLQHLKPL
ncbi:hypothetical protein PAFU01_10790 [Pantoea ananatis]|nr:hypothetical protein C7424_0726 [Pantoea ananatis]BBL29631.1 hypothetical protein PAFU01_10790 [Pantoea ananatis]